MVSEQDRDKLIAFIHDELDLLEVQRLAMRLRAEDDLRAEYEALMNANDSLEDLFTIEAKEDLSFEQIAKVVGKQAKPKSPRPHRWLYYTGGSAIAASLALVLWMKQDVSPEHMLAQAPARFDKKTPSPESLAAMDQGMPTEGLGGGGSDLEPEKKRMIVADLAPPPPPPTKAAELASPPPPTEVAMSGRAAKDMVVADNFSEQMNEAAPLVRAEPEAAYTAESRARGATVKLKSKVAAKAGTAATEPKKWSACQTSADCTLVEDFCNWRSINKKFVKAFNQSARTKPIQCKSAKPAAGSKNKFKAVCQKQKCVRQDR